jgi:tRNA(Ile2)-agmatinylcytidine synthase
MRYLMGMDDTDSRFGHCTTHLGYLIVSELARAGCVIPTYPRLVRLNPNIPFKTRGNAAVCIEFEVASRAMSEEAFETAERLLEAEADVANGANSALIMAPADNYEYDDDDDDDGAAACLALFRKLYERALRDVVNYRGVIRAVSQMGIRQRLLGNGMGIVGAAASLGFSCASDDHTYELIAYRRPERCGTSRAVDPLSVRMMERKTFPHTFNSYDHESRRVLISPTGPDPVLAGIRGDSPSTVLEAFGMVHIEEEKKEALGYMIYATNQCTEAHLKKELTMPLKVYSAGWLEGPIFSIKPCRGGHLEIQLGAAAITAAAGPTAIGMVYEPSGDLRRIARSLRPGDVVRLYGGVRRASTLNPAVLNVEKIEILEVSRDEEATKVNPECPVCGLRMKSEGRAKGFQCRRCGHRCRHRRQRRSTTARATNLNHAVVTTAPERIYPGVYLPSPRAQRHLTKQLVRYGREHTGIEALIEDWMRPPPPSPPP